jgi:beta-lactamase superfamily II metal-dependent hydrolase
LNRNKFKTSGFITVLAIGLLFVNFEFNKNLKITFLDVGLGDSILIKTEDNKTILVDAADSEQTAMYKISPWLKENGAFANRLFTDHTSSLSTLWWE